MLDIHSYWWFRKVITLLQCVFWGVMQRALHPGIRLGDKSVWFDFYSKRSSSCKSRWWFDLSNWLLLALVEWKRCGVLNSSSMDARLLRDGYLAWRQTKYPLESVAQALKGPILLYLPFLKGVEKISRSGRVQRAFYTPGCNPDRGWFPPESEEA